MSDPKTLSPEEAAELLRCFASPLPKIREAAFQFALTITPHPELEQGLLKALSREEEHPPSKSCALLALGLHAQTHAAREAISPFFDSEDDELCVQAARAFWRAGGNPKIVTSVAVLKLKSDNYFAPEKALELLSEMKEEAAGAADFLVDIAQGGGNNGFGGAYSPLRKKALQALWGMGTSAKRVASPISMLLCDPSPEVSYWAMAVLENIGATPACIPHLIQALNYRDQKSGEIRDRHIGFLFAGGEDLHLLIVNELAKFLDRKEVQDALRELSQRPTDISEARSKALDHPQVAQARDLLNKLGRGRWRERRPLEEKLQEAMRQNPPRTTSPKARERALEILAFAN